MPDEYDKALAELRSPSATPTTPRRSRTPRSSSGKIEFQPENSDWAIDRAPELETFFHQATGRSLPVRNRGQGAIHNRWGYDHRDSLDIGLNPSSTEGQTLISHLKERQIPFLAFSEAIPGVATGPHIHVGRASSRTPKRFAVGTTSRSSPSSEGDATAQGDEYDQALRELRTPARRSSTTPLLTRNLSAPSNAERKTMMRPLGGVSELTSNTPNINQILTEARKRPSLPPAPYSPYTGGAGPVIADSGAGALRRIDDREVARQKRISEQVAKESAATRELQERTAFRYGAPDPNADRAAETENAEVLRRVAAEKASEAERQRLLAQFTPEDIQQTKNIADQLRRHGPGVKKGIDQSVQRATSSLLYKLAGLTQIPTLGQGDNPAGDWLRRKALAGELSIEEVSNLPPPQREKVAEFLSGMVVGLPEIIGATALGGPVGGFAALHGSEALGRNLPAKEVIKETAKGATTGAVFKGAGRTGNVVKELGTIGAGTAATELAFGATPEDAAKAALTNVAFAGGMKVLHRPTKQPIERQTVPEATQAKLREYEHLQFGRVSEAEKQTSVPRGKVKVVDQEGAEHVIQKPSGLGRGNERAIPTRESRTAEIVPPEAATRPSVTPPEGGVQSPSLPILERPSKEVLTRATVKESGTTSSEKQIAPEGVGTSLNAPELLTRPKVRLLEPGSKPKVRVLNPLPEPELITRGPKPELLTRPVPPKAPEVSVEPSTPTAAKRSSMASDREAFDLPELTRPIRRSDVDVFAAAKEANKADPTEAGRIAEKVLGGKHTLTDRDTALLDMRAAEIKAKHSQALKEIAEAKDPEVIASKGADADALKSEFDRLSEAADTGGTELARALRIRRRSIDDRYELLPMLAEAKKAKGRELKPEERLKVESQAKQIQELTQKLAEAEDRARVASIQKQIDKVARQRKRSDTKASLDTEFAELKTLFVQAKAEIPRVQASGLAALDPDGRLTVLIAKMARNRVQSGVVKAEAVVDEVYSAVREHVEGVTKRDIRDAISGYGLSGKDRRSDLTKQLAEVRSELKKLSETEDVEAGKLAPRREGPRKSEAAQSGIPLAGPKRGDIRRVPPQGPRQSEARSSGLPLEGPRLSDIRRVPIPGPRMSEASRSGQPLQGPKMSDVRKVRAEGPRPSEARKLPAIGVPRRFFSRDVTRRNQLLKQEAELQRRLSTRDFSEVTKPEPLGYTRETYQLQKQINETKATYERELYRATRGVGGKMVDTAAGVGNVPKTMLSMGDFSALLRQGGYNAVTHPVLSTKAAADMLKSMSGRGWANVEAQIKAHPLFEEARRSGIEFTGIDKNDPRLSRREEGYLGSDFIDTIARGKANPLRLLKGVKDVSERTFVSFLDSQRMRVYSQQANAIKGMRLSRGETAAALKAQAKLINIATGRGSLGEMGNNAAPLLNLAMFSPRLLASRIQLLNKMFNPVAWANTPRGARKLMMIDNAKFLAFTMTTLGLAKAAGVEVNLDWDSPDFLKYKIFDTRYDTLTGLQQPLRFFLRMASAVKGGEAYAGDTKSDILMDFGRSKSSPSAGYVWDFIEGKNRLSGKEFEPGKDLARTVVPLPLQEFTEAIKHDGALRGIVETLPSLAGVGVQTYKGSAEKPSTHAEKLARRMIIRKMPDTARDQAELDKSQKVSDLRARSRRGEDISKELPPLNLTPRQEKSLVEAKGKTRLQEDFNRLSIEDAITVYKIMNRGEQESVRAILQQKSTKVEEMPEDRQAKVKKLLEAIGMKPGQVPRGPQPVRQPRQARQPRGQGYVFSPGN